MDTKSYKVLKPSFSTNGHIFFSYTKINIQKDLHSYAIPIIVLPIMLISNPLNFYNAYRKEDTLESIFFLLVTIIFITLSIYQLIDYKKAKKVNGKAYNYQQIKQLKVKEWKRNAKLVFEFEDGTKHKLFVKKDESFLQFIRNINFANVKLA